MCKLESTVGLTNPEAWNGNVIIRIKYFVRANPLG
jgi:hypothetical protein